MAPDPGFIAAPSMSPIELSLEPAHNVLNNLVVLKKVANLSGMDEWTRRVYEGMTPEQRQTNRVVIDGFLKAIVPDRSWPGFPAYVDHLSGMAPEMFPRRLFAAYLNCTKGDTCCPAGPPLDPNHEYWHFDYREYLESVDKYIGFLMERFPADHLDMEIESEAFRYLKDPPALKAMIVNHLKEMWQEVLANDWEKNRHLLQASIDAFRQSGIERKTKEAAAEMVLLRDIEDEIKPDVNRAERLILVPSAHLGPYICEYRCGTTMWLLFGARIPEGVRVNVPELSRAEILVRVNALADDTRLRILKLIAEEGEKRSMEIMDRLALSQSAASRHLKQLSATGYLIERRCDTAKSYRLNPKRLENTLRALSNFLTNRTPS